MALVTNIVKKVEIPHEQGEWMEFRKLSWRQMEAAEERATDAAMERVKKIGGDILQALRKIGDEQQQQRSEQDPAARYDRQAVLEAGILRWSYDVPVDEGAIDLLDEETAAWAFREILDLNKPMTEEERKNA